MNEWGGNAGDRWMEKRRDAVEQGLKFGAQIADAWKGASEQRGYTGTEAGNIMDGNGREATGLRLAKPAVPLATAANTDGLRRAVTVTGARQHRRHVPIHCRRSREKEKELEGRSDIFRWVPCLYENVEGGGPGKRFQARAK